MRHPLQEGMLTTLIGFYNVTLLGLSQQLGFVHDLYLNNKTIDAAKATNINSKINANFLRLFLSVSRDRKIRWVA